MPCPHCVGADRLFDERTARRELERFRRKGPTASTRKLVASVRGRGTSLLDIGGGVGAVQHALAEAGTERVTGVDASHAYLAAVTLEAERRGYPSEQHFGDFVEIAERIEPHDVVTLDRVLCCYPDLDALVDASASRARRAYGVVFPKERWWTRLGATLVNLGLRLWRSEYRAYVHSEARVDALVAAHGLQPTTRDATWLWNVRAWERP